MSDQPRNLAKNVRILMGTPTPKKTQIGDRRTSPKGRFRHARERPAATEAHSTQSASPRELPLAAAQAVATHLR
jgi:hypothetical protein